MKVKDPTGQTWRVTRRWVPWRRRLKGHVRGLDLIPSGLGDDPLSILILGVFLVIALPFVVLALIAGLELLLALLLLPFALVGRVLLGKHWSVEARRGFTIWWDAPAGDWQASGIRIHEVADDVRRGALPPRTVGGPPEG